MIFIFYNKNDSKIDIVISRYNENIDWLYNYNLDNFNTIYIYNKGNTFNNKFGNNVVVISLPNVGRENHTYLYHIISNYNNLADVTIFLPGSSDMPIKWSRVDKTIKKVLQTKKSVFYVQHYKNVKNELYDFKLNDYKSTNYSNSAINPESKLQLCPERPFGVWYEKNFGNVIINGTIYGCMFAVSKNDIFHRSLNFYKTLIKYLDNHSNPEAGHYFERAHLAIFYPINNNCIYSTID